MSRRKHHIIAEIKKTFTELSGQELGEVDAAIGFLDVGFDSMFLTQAAAALKNRFGVKVTFRQLNDDLSTFETLAEFLEGQLPARVEQPSKEKPAGPAKAPQNSQTEIPAAPQPDQDIPAVFAGQNESSPTSTVLERVVKEQLRVMEAQLALLRRSAPAKLTESAAAMQPQIAAPMAAPQPPERDVSKQPASAPGATTQHGPFRQIDRAEKGGLTPQQRAHLDWFIPRYLAKTPKSKAYTQLHRRHFADPRAVAGFKSNWKEMVYPIVSTRSSGAYLWDLDGNRWVDVTMGFGVALLGHSPPFITEAVKKQLDLGVEIGPQSPLAGEVAQLICEFTDMDRETFFTNC